MTVTVQVMPVASMGGVDRARIPVYVTRDLLAHEYDTRTLSSHSAEKIDVFSIHVL